jgi:hypothetical protein
MFQFIMLVGITAGVVLGYYELRKGVQPPPAQTNRRETGAPARNESPQPSQEELAPKVASKTLNWPWNTCGHTAKDINGWLGQGAKRAQIEKMAGAIEKKIGNQETRKEQAAQYWCTCLSAGSGELVRLLQVETGDQPPRKKKKHHKKGAFGLLRSGSALGSPAATSLPVPGQSSSTHWTA